jgi:hypothetical protein
MVRIGVIETKSTSGLCAKYLTAKGYIAQKVEYWNSFGRKRIDFMGFADVLAYKDDETGVIAVQGCGRFDADRHLKNITDSCEVKLKSWLKAGNKFYIYEWDQLHRGKIRIRITEVWFADDFAKRIVSDEEISSVEIRKGKIVVEE